MTLHHSFCEEERNVRNRVLYLLFCSLFMLVSIVPKASAGSLDTGAIWSSVELTYKKITETDISLQVDMSVSARNGYGGTHSFEGNVNLLDNSGNKLWSSPELRLRAEGSYRETGHDGKLLSLNLNPFPNGGYTLQLIGTLRSDTSSYSNKVDDKMAITIDKPITATLTPEQAKQLKDAAQNSYNAWQAALDAKRQVIQSESNINNKLDTMENSLKNDFNNRISLAENNITKKLGDVESNLKTDITNMGTNINNKLGDMESNLKTDITNLGSDINKKLANINTSIVNIQSSNPPTLIKVAGYNKATATKNNTFKVSMTYSGANEYRWKLDGGDWSSWTSLKAHDESGYFTASGVNGAGTYTVMVEIRQASTVNDPATGKPTPAYSPVAKGRFSFFKL